MNARPQQRLYHGGRIYTMDEGRRVVNAVLTAGERIVAVGGLDEVRAQAAADVELVDLQGATMTPGLVDTHPHMLHWSWTTAMQVPLWDCRNHADIVAAIRAEAGKTPDGEVILCSPVGEPHFFHKRSYRDLEEAVLPDRHVLDEATSRHPVVITAWAPVRPAMMAANSRGLELLGVTADSADRIENVWIEKDPAGEPTGRLTGSVITYYGYDAYCDELMNRLVAHFKFDVLLPSVRDGIERYKRLGITAVYENHMLEDEMLEVYRQLRRDDDLAMRVVTSQEAEAYGFAWASQPREEADFRERLERAASKLELDDDLLRFNGVTVAWDGYCYGGTMMMREPYLDVYGKLTHGHRHISLERAEHLMRFCAERGMRLNILAMGLKAHDEVLELLERLDPEIDVAAQNWVLCHATTIENEQIDRFKTLGFAHTTSMAFGCGEGDLMCRTMGRHVLEHLHPLRHFLDVEMPVGAGTDWGPLSPWAQVQLSLTHELMESGYRNQGPNQRISRLEALAIFTSDAAKVLQWSEIGSIVPGNFADLTIVDRDPVECDVEMLHETQVLQTIFNGEAVG
jgi:predicted amidohydrolase YtcJ